MGLHRFDVKKEIADGFKLCQTCLLCSYMSAKFDMYTLVTPQKLYVHYVCRPV